jgi:hypothetical protein
VDWGSGIVNRRNIWIENGNTAMMGHVLIVNGKQVRMIWERLILDMPE